MSIKIYFTVFGKPQGKARPRFSRLNHRVYTPESTRLYEGQVRWAFLDAAGEKTALPAFGESPVKVSILACYPIPKHATKARRAAMEAGEILPTVKPDYDNIGKIICDALNGIAWEDDKQIVRATVEKRYGLEPMVHVVIEG